MFIKHKNLALNYKKEKKAICLLLFSFISLKEKGKKIVLIIKTDYFIMGKKEHKQKVKQTWKPTFLFGVNNH